jgi:hypothetical protein
MGLGTKNDCGGEGLQQVTQLTDIGCPLLVVAVTFILSVALSSGFMLIPHYKHFPMSYSNTLGVKLINKLKNDLSSW